MASVSSPVKGLAGRSVRACPAPGDRASVGSERLAAKDRCGGRRGLWCRGLVTPTRGRSAGCPRSWLLSSRRGGGWAGCLLPLSPPEAQASAALSRQPVPGPAQADAKSLRNPVFNFVLWETVGGFGDKAELISRGFGCSTPNSWAGRPAAAQDAESAGQGLGAPLAPPPPTAFEVSRLPRVTSMKDTRVSMTCMGVRPQGTPRRWGQWVHALQELGGQHGMGGC